MSANTTQGVTAMQHSADSAVAQWRAVSAALAPIIGQRGMAALLRRAVLLTGAGLPWFQLDPSPVLPEQQLAALQQLLASRPAAQAALANATLRQDFYHLLVNLIGVALTGRLLGAVWNSSNNSGDAAQDI